MLEVQEERPTAAATVTASATTAATGTAGNASGRKERAKERQEEGRDCSSPVATPNAGPRSARAKTTPSTTHTHSHRHTPSPHQHSTSPASVAPGLTSMHSSNPKVRNSPSANTQRWGKRVRFCMNCPIRAMFVIFSVICLTNNVYFRVAAANWSNYGFRVSKPLLVTVQFAHCCKDSMWINASVQSEYYTVVTGFEVQIIFTSGKLECCIINMSQSCDVIQDVLISNMMESKSVVNGNERFCWIISVLLAVFYAF